MRDTDTLSEAPVEATGQVEDALPTAVEERNTENNNNDIDCELTDRPVAALTFDEILERRMERRKFVKGSVAATGAAAAGSSLLFSQAAAAKGKGKGKGKNGDSLTFEPIEGSSADAVILPKGYDHDVLCRWGDSLRPTTPHLDTSKLKDGILTKTGIHKQVEWQIGYNHDAIEYFPLPGPQYKGRRRGLVCINHEYTNDDMIFPTFGSSDSHPLDPRNEDNPGFDVEDFVNEFPESVKVAQALHGVSVVELRRTRRGWRYRRNSYFNRRITGYSPIEITGPAAGADLLKTSYDPTGTMVKGTLNNCAGGQTPWGTYLSAEENFDQYFGNFSGYADSGSADAKVLEYHRRVPLPGNKSPRGWEFGDSRFDVAQEPNEAFRFGWIVEIDPYNPNSTPKKRTAMGRFKHECATTIASTEGKCVVYSGDDARFEYTFKFVSKKSISRRRRDNIDLLDEGTLYVAKLNDDGTGEWLPLDIDDPVSGPILKQGGFTSQADVLINARYAGDLLGATPMDRPEDVEANPVTKKVYIACTNNSRRDGKGVDITAQGRQVSDTATVPNPRAEDGPGNRYGHVVEITEANDDNASTTFTWEIFILCGDPLDDQGSFLTSYEDLNDLPLRTWDSYFGGFDQPEKISPIGSPDNLGFDEDGNLWIVTDGGQPRGTNNGAFAVPTEGPNRGYLRQFMSTATDSEVCGCEFTPDYRTLFLCIQHPGDGGTLRGGFTSDWPDRGGLPPRPSVVAVTKKDGGKIGS